VSLANTNIYVTLSEFSHRIKIYYQNIILFTFILKSNFGDSPSKNYFIKIWIKNDAAPNPM